VKEKEKMKGNKKEKCSERERKRSNGRKRRDETEREREGGRRESWMADGWRDQCSEIVCTFSIFSIARHP